MTDEELRAIEARAAIARDVAMDDVPKLASEVQRLRALVKDAEWFSGVGAYDSESGCPWCESDGFYEASKLGHGRHRPECQAFHENGEVR